MRQIRRGVFETNSSSTHSLTMCSKADYEKWENGTMLYDRWGEKLVLARDIKREEKKCDEDDTDEDDNYGDDDYDDNQYQTIEEWKDGYLEKFYDEYTTASGEVIVAFGEFGYDG